MVRKTEMWSRCDHATWKKHYAESCLHPNSLFPGITDGKWQYLSALLHPRVLQPPIGILFGLRSLPVNFLPQEMICGNTARGQTVRNDMATFIHFFFFARKVFFKLVIWWLINNVHTAYAILLSHFHGLFSLMWYKRVLTWQECH